MNLTYRKNYHHLAIILASLAYLFCCMLKLVKATSVYTDWRQCGDFECYDKLNECNRTGSDFSSQDCQGLLSESFKCLNTCKTTEGSDISCLEPCQPYQVSTLLSEQFTACRLDANCLYQLQLNNYLVQGYYQCFLACYNKLDEFQIMPLQDNLYGDYSQCLENTCGDLRNACFAYQGCINFFDIFYRGVITCSMSNGTYNQYKESWTKSEFYIQSRCIQQTYHALFPENEQQVPNFRRAMKYFLCYVDCSLGDNSINKLQKYKDNMTFLEECSIIQCGPQALTECPDDQTCWSYGRGVNACMRLQILYEENIDFFPDFNQLVVNCSHEILDGIDGSNKDGYIGCLKENCSTLSQFVYKLIFSLFGLILLLFCSL